MRRTSIVSHLLNTYYKPAFLYRSLTFFLTAGTIKVIVVGNGAVGKTSMIQRFCKGGFGNDYIKTLGVDFIEKPDYRVDSIDDAVTMNVWDTAGQEEYDAVTAQYYRDMNTAPCLVRRYYTVRAPPNLTSILIVSPQNYGRKKTKICLAVKHKMFALGAGGGRGGGG